MSAEPVIVGLPTERIALEQTVSIQMLRTNAHVYTLESKYCIEQMLLLFQQEREGGKCGRKTTHHVPMVSQLVPTLLPRRKIRIVGHLREKQQRLSILNIRPINLYLVPVYHLRLLEPHGAHPRSVKRINGMRSVRPDTSRTQ